MANDDPLVHLIRMDFAAIRQTILLASRMAVEGPDELGADELGADELGADELGAATPAEQTDYFLSMALTLEQVCLRLAAEIEVLGTQVGALERHLPPTILE